MMVNIGRRISAGIVAACLASNVSGQVTLPTPPPTPEQFLQGPWDTSRGARVPIVVGVPDTIVLPPLLVHANIWEVSTPMDFRIDTDRGTTPKRLTEGSQMIVEGKAVEIRQATAGRTITGWWAALTQPRQITEVTTSFWSVLPGKSVQLLDLREPRLFVLTFEGSRAFPFCNTQPHSLTVSVDDQPLKYLDGTSVKLTIQNSLISYGSKVYVTRSGACQPPATQDTRFFGTVKIANIR